MIRQQFLQKQEKCRRKYELSRLDPKNACFKSCKQFIIAIHSIGGVTRKKASKIAGMRWEDSTINVAYATLGKMGKLQSSRSENMTANGMRFGICSNDVAFVI